MFIERVCSHPILWDSHDDEYKLAEKKPVVLYGIAAQCDCDWCKYAIRAFIYWNFTNLTTLNVTSSKLRHCLPPMWHMGDEIVHRWLSLAILSAPGLVNKQSIRYKYA